MRKKLVLGVFVTVTLAGGWTDAAQPADKEVRIVRTLEEAAPVAARPLLLVFFSLDCRVCWEELFEMKYFLENNSIPIDLVGVAREAEEELRPFLTKFSFFYPVISDPQKTLHRRFKARLEPFRVVLERDRVLYQDDTAQDFFVRREKAKKCLLELASR
ncbi:MAG: redoxin domain-containing protein [Acidobacteriota bacterium]